MAVGIVLVANEYIPLVPTLATYLHHAGVAFLALRPPGAQPDWTRLSIGKRSSARAFRSVRARSPWALRRDLAPVWPCSIMSPATTASCAPTTSSRHERRWPG